MSTADFTRKVFSMVERDLQSRPPGIEFEMAYQARVAADRIRFAVSQIDEPARHRDQLHEASMQLLDALDRLESAERRFQVHSKLSGSGRPNARRINNVRGQQTKSKASSGRGTIRNIHDEEREL